MPAAQFRQVFYFREVENRPRSYARIVRQTGFSPGVRWFRSHQSWPTHSWSTPIRYPTYLELQANRRTRGYVFRLPGLCLEHDTPEEILREMTGAIRTELTWLGEHGVEISEEEKTIEIDEVERIELDTDVSRGKWRGLFRYEMRPTVESDVNTTLERTAFSRQDLIQTIPGTEHAREIYALLEQHAERELLLLSRLGSHVSVRLPEDPWEQLDLVRAKAIERLQNLLPGDRERHAVFEGEQWTTRKVLRCFAVAERRLGDRVRASLSKTTPEKPSSPSQSPR